MDGNRFFKFLWRMNAILILCVLVLVIGKFVHEAFDQPPNRKNYVPNLVTYAVDPAGETVIEERWMYGRPSEVIGASSFVLPLHSIGNTDEPSYDLRNLLFVDANLENSKWLLPDNEKHIASYEFLRFRDRDRVLAVLYEVTDKDVDDKEPAEGGNGASIYLSRPNGKELTQVVASLDRILGHTMTNERQLVIFYVKDGMAYAEKIALSDLTVVESLALSPVE